MPLSADQIQSKRQKRSWHEQLLLHLLTLAILLPSAAQAIITGFAGLRFLFLHGWKPLRHEWPQKPLSQELKSIFARLFQGFLLVMLGHLLIAALQCLRAAIRGEELWPSVIPYLRLAGKQGFYGAFLVMTCLLGVLRKPSRPAWWQPIRWPLLGIYLFILAAYMLGQRTWGWDWVHGWHAQLGDHRFAYGVYRASGFMGHPLTLAYNCLLFAVFSFAQGLWLYQHKQPEAWGWWLVSLMLLGLLQLTGSRFPLVLALSLMVWASGLVLIKRPRRRLLILAVLVFGLLIAIVGSSLLDGNLSGRWAELWDSNIPWEDRFDRVIFWKVNALMFWDHPWFGTGLAGYDRQLLDYYNRSGYTQMERKYVAHNIFLQTLADSGILGTLVLLLMLGVCLRTAIQVQRLFRNQALMLIWLATVLGGLMQNNLRDSEYLFALWISLGLCCSCLLAWGIKIEPESRSNLKDYQPGANISDSSSDVPGSYAGATPD